MKTSLNLPKLGFGFMRLPMNGDQIDYTVLNAMVDESMKQGFNYFDTAYVYHGGESEVALKKSLVDRYPRESYMIADKLPAWRLDSREDVQKIFDEQLARLGVEYIDYYLLHSIEAVNIDKYNTCDCFHWAQEMKEKGLIRHFGFSFHDKPELLDKLLTEHPEAEFVQLQINYVDWDNIIVYSGACYEVARKHDIPIIIMEPVKGGMLASLRPELEEMLKKTAPNQTIASWGFRFCWSLDGIATVLSGMSTLEQVKENIQTAQNFTPLTEEEKKCLDEVTKTYMEIPIIGCTGCSYCTEGCPVNIPIPNVISAYNTVLTYGDHDRPHFYYNSLTTQENKANACVKCGQCESVCPQHLNIIEILGKASEVFDK